MRAVEAQQHQEQLQASEQAHCTALTKLQSTLSQEHSIAIASVRSEHEHQLQELQEQYSAARQQLQCETDNLATQCRELQSWLAASHQDTSAQLQAALCESSLKTQEVRELVTSSVHELIVATTTAQQQLSHLYGVQQQLQDLSPGGVQGLLQQLEAARWVNDDVSRHDTAGVGGA